MNISAKICHLRIRQIPVRGHHWCFEIQGALNSVAQERNQEVTFGIQGDKRFLGQISPSFVFHLIPTMARKAVIDDEQVSAPIVSRLSYRRPQLSRSWRVCEQQNRQKRRDKNGIP